MRMQTFIWLQFVGVLLLYFPFVCGFILFSWFGVGGVVVVLGYCFLRENFKVGWVGRGSGGTWGRERI